MASGPERFLAATAHLPITPHRMPDSTHTAAEAAAAVGCEVGAIVKSLVFVAVHDGMPGEPERRQPILAPVRTIVDRDFLRFDTVWSAAGSAYDVFPASPHQLLDWTAGDHADIGTR